MAYYSTTQIAEVWGWAGGTQETAVYAVAVALAESGGNTGAISPSGDYGLWQINAAVWFGRTGGCGLGWGNWWQPGVNACAAMRISDSGRNWAPWCTAWADPARDCGHGYLPVPQPGSAAGRILDRLPKTGTLSGTPPAPGNGAGQANAESGWQDLADFFHDDMPARYRTIDGVRERVLTGMRYL